MMADAEFDLLAEIANQEKLEQVSPKLERFRNGSIGGSCPEYIRIKGCRGGRGAGAKSWGLTSLIVQRANFESIRVACLREIQQSLEESVYELIEKTVSRLNYQGWRFTREYIASSSGSYFIFKGMKDLRASMSIKGLEGFDIFFMEEAASLSRESLDLALPTLMRTPGSELWFCYNPETESDPITEKIWSRDRSDALCIDLLPGPVDNPWWNSGLQKEMDEDFKFDPDEAEHIWNGLPRKQGQNSVLSRQSIRGAMDRAIDPIGAIEIGADIARFGDDSSVFYSRRGNKITGKRSMRKASTPEVARALWDFANRDPSVVIRVDSTGVGGGVTDILREFGANVIPVNFGNVAMDQNKYNNVSSELWFSLLIDEIDIPNDPELMRQLSGRQYYYDTKGRQCVESKDEYKKRLGKSPDDADALLLTFYRDYNIKMSDSIKKQLANRRKCG